MGTWGVQPWDSDDAAEWFEGTLQGINDIDSKISAALKYRYDNYEEVRSAAYLLQVLGISYVWPGDLEKLKGHIQRAIELLTAMIDQKSADSQMDFLQLWDNDPEVIASVKEQIEQLKNRL
jgi:hypothetical protein